MTPTKSPALFTPFLFLVPLAITASVFTLADAYASGSARAIEETADLAATPPKLTVGGTVSGLHDVGATTIVLELDGEEVALAKDGAFRFSSRLTRGAFYRVKVSQAPEGEACSIARASGMVGNVDVTDVTVRCVPSRA